VRDLLRISGKQMPAPVVEGCAGAAPSDHFLRHGVGESLVQTLGEVADPVVVRASRGLLSTLFESVHVRPGLSSVGVRLR
jgi:hypothetical protein